MHKFAETEKLINMGIDITPLPKNKSKRKYFKWIVQSLVIGLIGLIAGIAWFVVPYYNEAEEDDGMELLIEKAEQGDVFSQYELGECYENGWGGMIQDYAEAAKWYTKAAKQGFLEAQCILGAWYCRGQGVAQDYEKAAEWYAKAAEQGSMIAKDNLEILKAKNFFK